MDDKIFQNSLCITSMKQKLSGPIEAHGPFIILVIVDMVHNVSQLVHCGIPLFIARVTPFEMTMIFTMTV